MFDQLTPFMLASGYVLPSASELEEFLKTQQFEPTGPTQEKSVGFVPPRGVEHGPLVESIGGHHILRLAIETKSVPGSTIREKVAEQVAEIERSTGRQPGKKERRDMQQDMLLSLLPSAFPRRSDVYVWIDPKARRVLIGSTSQGKVDEAVSSLIKSIPSLSLQLLQTSRSPQACMTEWLLAKSPDDWPDDFYVERNCTLKSTGEDASTIRYVRHNLATDEVRKHVTEGKLPTDLSVSWDGRMAFVLNECLRLRKIQFLDGVLDARGADKNEDRFDADIALATGMLSPCLDGLIAALGGLMDLSGDAK